MYLRCLPVILEFAALGLLITRMLLNYLRDQALGVVQRHSRDGWTAPIVHGDPLLKLKTGTSGDAPRWEMQLAWQISFQILRQSLSHILSERKYRNILNCWR
jgi:hypothetical protein